MAREKGMGNLQREKSGRWTMRVGINGKRYCRSTRTKDRDQAERELQRFLAPLGLGERRLPLADVWIEYLRSPYRNEIAKTTLEAKRQVWMHFARWMEHFYLPVKDLGGITADMVGEYLACLRADVSASTYNGRLCILREIFRLLAKKAGIESDPWEGVRLRPSDSHSRRELTMDELRRLLDAAKAVDVRCSRTKEDSNIHCTPTPSTYTSEWHKLIMIGIYTGLRLGDCCNLDWSSVNLAQGVIQLIPAKTKRHANGRPVTIPIHPALGRALLLGTQVPDGTREKRPFYDPAYDGLRPTPESQNGQLASETLDASNTSGAFLNCGVASNASVVSHIEKSPLIACREATCVPKTFGPVMPGIAEMYGRARWQVSHELSRIFKAAHIVTSVRIEGRRKMTPEATFHSLRHTFVSFAANAGVPLHIVQSIVGHESTAMTRHYYHENLAALKSAVAAIPTL